MGYEMYAALNDAALLAESYTDRFLALLFAFLIASYLVAAKLDRLIAWIVVALYSVMALRYGFVYYNVTGDVIALADEVRQYAAQPGSEIAWLEIGPIDINYYGVLVLYVLGYIASLVFFFHMRHRHSGPTVVTKDVLG